MHGCKHGRHIPCLPIFISRDAYHIEGMYQGKDTYPFRLHWAVRSSEADDLANQSSPLSSRSCRCPQMPVEILRIAGLKVGWLAGTGLRVDSLGRLMLLSHVPATGVWRRYLLGICKVLNSWYHDRDLFVHTITGGPHLAVLEQIAVTRAESLYVRCLVSPDQQE